MRFGSSCVKNGCRASHAYLTTKGIASSPFSSPNFGYDKGNLLDSASQNFHKVQPNLLCPLGKIPSFSRSSLIYLLHLARAARHHELPTVGYQAKNTTHGSTFLSKHVKGIWFFQAQFIKNQSPWSEWLLAWIAGISSVNSNRRTPQAIPRGADPSFSFAVRVYLTNLKAL